VSYAYGVKCEFLRYAFAQATALSKTVAQVLDAWAADALQSAVTGKTLISASGGGVSSGFAFFDGWNPQELLSLINWARAYEDETDAATAIASLSGPCRAVRPEFTQIPS
jgi:hypothetical protein